jgi:hypothetical protein
MCLTFDKYLHKQDMYVYLVVHKKCEQQQQQQQTIPTPITLTRRCNAVTGNCRIGSRPGKAFEENFFCLKTQNESSIQNPRKRRDNFYWNSPMEMDLG